MREQVAVGLVLRLAERQLAVPQVGRAGQEPQRVGGEVEFGVGRDLPGRLREASGPARPPRPATASARRRAARPATGTGGARLAAVAVLDPVEHRRRRIACLQRRLGVLLHHQRDPEDRGRTQQQADDDAGRSGHQKPVHAAQTRRCARSWPLPRRPAVPLAALTGLLVGCSRPATEKLPPSPSPMTVATPRLAPRRCPPRPLPRRLRRRAVPADVDRATSWPSC